MALLILERVPFTGTNKQALVLVVMLTVVAISCLLNETKNERLHIWK